MPRSCNRSSRSDTPAGGNDDPTGPGRGGPEFTALDVELHGHLAVVTLNNPPVNALSRALNDELTDAMDWASEDSRVHAVVLLAAGHVFCAGADLSAREDLSIAGNYGAHARRTRECFHALRECAKPVIVGVDGPALGAGLAMIASCDLVLVSPSASLGLPEVDVGLLGGTRHAMRMLGQTAVRYLALTGDRVGGEQLLAWGMAVRCVPSEELTGACLALGRQIAEKSPVATSAIKRTMNLVEDLSLRDGYRFEQEMTQQVSRSAQAREALSAFLEKRPPRFTDHDT